MPGYIGADMAVSREWAKRDVLIKMDGLKLDSLPVVDKDGFFVGTVERSQLTASLILELAVKLGAKTTSAD